MKFSDGEYFLNFNGIDHWVKVEGSANETLPLIIIHGGPGGNHYTFERTAGPLLSAERTVVYYEQRGCGRSAKPESDDDYIIELLIEDFSDLKRWLGTEKVDLLGYSFGGELALEICHAIPDEINNLILSAPSLMESGLHKLVQLSGFSTVAGKELFHKIQKLQKDTLSIDALYEKVWDLADASTVDSLLFEDQEIAKTNRKWWNESSLINTGLMAKALENHPRLIPLKDRLKEINHQCLIITGVYDRNTGVTISKIIHRKMPQSKLVMFDKSAHFPDIEETDKFARVVLNFLNANERE